MGRIGPIDVAGQRLYVYAESPPLFEDMLADIGSAQKRVWLETYIFADDAVGARIAQALIERAAAGVDCRVMYDYVGSAGTSREFFAKLEAGGVLVHCYHNWADAMWGVLPFRGVRPWRIINQRDHRKLLVVDDHVAYFGGMNVVDQSGLDTRAKTLARALPSSAGWRDVHVRMEGPRQADVATIVEDQWSRESKGKRRRLPAWNVERMLATERDGLWFFDTRPTSRQRRAARVFAPLIASARSRLVVAMAYFIPLGPVLRALGKAGKRGVVTRVIVPGASDVKLVQWCAWRLYAKLLARGIRLFERRDRMLHSKMMVVDDRWSVIGSCNMDPRSLLVNLEFFAVIRSEELARALKRVAAFELRASRKVTREACQARPWWQRLLDRIAWWMRRLL